MTMQLEPTGERVIEDAYQRSLGGYVIYMLHQASYRFAEQYCINKKVIDLGCGSGYGAARIAKIASSVEAIDISQEAIDFANARYQSENLKYRRIDPDTVLPYASQTFDVALSFQVIEHVNNPGSYLSEAQRILKPGGVLIVITPDRTHRLLPGQKPWNRWHLHEYSPAELGCLVENYFEQTRILRMGAPWFIARVEHRRYRLTKWLTLPFTLPFIPETLRQRGLNFIHSLRNPPAPVSAEHTEKPLTFNFGERDIVISENAKHSMNIVAIARRPSSISP